MTLTKDQLTAKHFRENYESILSSTIQTVEQIRSNVGGSYTIRTSFAESIIYVTDNDDNDRIVPLGNLPSFYARKLK